MISIVNTECHVPKTFSDLAKIAAWGRLGLFRHHTNLLCSRPMARPKRQEDPLLPVPLPRRRPSRANTRNLAASVKPELAAEIKNLAEREQTSVAAQIGRASCRERVCQYV